MINEPAHKIATLQSDCPKTQIIISRAQQLVGRGCGDWKLKHRTEAGSSVWQMPDGQFRLFSIRIKAGKHAETGFAA